LISQREFEDGWDFLVTLLVEESIDSAGVSPGQITLAITSLIVWLAFVFAFIFLAIGAWFTSGPFESAVQSMFVGVTGFLSQRLRGKSVAEKNEDELESLVRKFVSESSTKQKD
jgi:hypothetical protein